MNNKIYNNIISGGWESGDYALSVYPSTNIQIFNNFIQATNGVILGLYGVGTVNDLTFINNIVCADTNKYLVDAVKVSSCLLDYNNYCGGKYFGIGSHPNRTVFSSFDNYQQNARDPISNQKWGQNSFYADSLFLIQAMVITI